MGNISPESKQILDNILYKNKTDIVGGGYIDIIVPRSNYKDLIRELIFEGFKINTISWWESCKIGEDCEYGIGGPESMFHDVWYAELPVELDEFEMDEAVSQQEKEKTVEFICSIIEAKEIKYPYQVIQFKTADWLTPAIWLEVPEHWKNELVK